MKSVMIGTRSTMGKLWPELSSKEESSGGSNILQSTPLWNDGSVLYTHLPTNQ